MIFTEPPFQKILYLLNDPGKGKFFRSSGFKVEYLQVLRAAILNMAEYEIVGDIETPAGKNASVKSGWWMDPGQSAGLRFVTAYPNDQPVRR